MTEETTVKVLEAVYKGYDATLVLTEVSHHETGDMYVKGIILSAEATREEISKSRSLRLDIQLEDKDGNFFTLETVIMSGVKFRRDSTFEAFVRSSNDTSSDNSRDTTLCELILRNI